MTRSIEILDQLVGFASVSSDSNLAIVDHIQDLLERIGAHVVRIRGETDQKAGVFARIGPDKAGGVLLSGHTDVVPVEGQAWSADPFRLRRGNGRLYGRGTADMKGFIACSLAAAERAAATSLAEPLMLSLSWDEEIGCRGIPHMLPHMEAAIGRPGFCIVGEPTSMQIALGHKGKMAFRAVCTGQAGHSSMAPDYVNAIHVAADFISKIRSMQDDLESRGVRDNGYEIPYTTVHVGRICGGRALNIVPDRAEVELELRYPAGEDPVWLRGAIEAAAEATVAPARRRWPGAELTLEKITDYPGLGTPVDADVVCRLQSLLPGASLTKVAYGTEAGYFAEAGVPTVVCGPGNMDQGHKADEFVEIGQLVACDEFLDRLIARLGGPAT